MKKRSLFAAVAMLIVSALVLTSATYAWFAANDEADVDEIKASVEGVEGSLLLAAIDDFSNAANHTLKTKLTSSDWTNLSSTLQPVSFRFGTTASPAPNGAPDIYKVAYDGYGFKGATPSTSDYVRYAFKVQYKTSSATTQDVVMTPTLDIDSDFGYVLVRVKDYGQSTYVNYIFSKTDGDSYTPVKQITGTGVVIDDHHEAEQGVDHGTAGIVDSGIDTVPTGMTLEMGPAVQGDNDAVTSGIVLIPAGTAAGTLYNEVQVYIWAEGNDTDCIGSASSADVGVSFHFSLEDPTP